MQSGHDNMSLLFSLLDECLFYFSTEDIIFRDVRIIYFDRENFKIKVRCFGETFDIRNKHNQGTEIKAITYSAMQVCMLVCMAENMRMFDEYMRVYVYIYIYAYACI